MTLQRVALNNNNFIRWYSATTPVLATSQYSSGLHNGYLLRWRAHQDFMPILVGDTVTIYTNFDTNLIGASDVVKVVKDGVVINDATQYIVSDTAFGTNNNKITLTIPVTNTDRGTLIQLAIVDGVDAIQYLSNHFKVYQATEKTINNTHLIKFYHNSNVYNYEWATFVPETDTPYTIRLASSVVEVSYPIEKETYEEATTGRVRTTRSINKKQYGFEMYWADEERHDAIATISNYKYFEVNGKEFVITELETAYQQNLNLFKSVLTLQDVEFGRRVNTCSNLT